MILRQVVFWIFAAETGIASVAVVAVRNIVHAALMLVAALMGAAGIFILFGAEFVGLVQILVYVGAVSVLFLFGIMLTSARPGPRPVDNQQRPLAALVAAGIFGVLAAGIVGAFGTRRLDLEVAFPTSAIGEALFRRWVLPFEAVSMLLLAALVGAIVLARRD